MYQIGLFALVAFSCVVALQNRYAGLLLCVLVAVIQDPVRKVTLGTPAYLTVAFVPVYLCMVLNLMRSTTPMTTVRAHFPELYGAAIFLVVALLASTAQTLSYGSHTLGLAFLGLFSYGGGVPAVLLGFFYIRKDTSEFDKPIVLMTLIISLMLIGVPLEHFGYKFSHPWLGTIATQGVWRRWYSSTGYVEMISGFYRSPEIMGWHAALLVILCVYLMARRPQWLPVWVALASWGFGCILLSGRRKMVIMVIVYLISFVILSRGWHRTKLLISLLIALSILLPVVLTSIDDRYVASAESSFGAASDRLSNQLVEGPLWLLENVGLFGYGVGVRTQGTQHLNVQINAPTHEGGFEKILVELGIVGTLSAFVFLYFFARSAWSSYRRTQRAKLDQTLMPALMSFIIANAAAFTVAFQIYGDPFVVFIVGFAGGVLLSGSRLALAREYAVLKQRRRAAQPLGAGAVLGGSS